MNPKNIINEKNFYQANPIDYTEAIDFFNQVQEGYDVSDGPGYSNANFVLNIKDFPEAIAQFDLLCEVVEMGIDGLRKMKSIIDNLKICWHGSDAVAHITNIIHIKAWIAVFTSSLYEFSHSMHRQLIIFNDTIDENRGQPYEVTAFKKIDISDLLVIDEYPVDNKGIFVDTKMAEEQYQKLMVVSNLYEDFCLRFFHLTDYLFSIWQSGGAKDKFEKNLERFQSSLREEYQRDFEEATKALHQAIENWKSNHVETNVG